MPGPFVLRLERELRERLATLEATRVAVDDEIARVSGAIRALAGPRAVRPVREVEPPPRANGTVTRREVVYVVDRLTEPFTHRDVADALDVELTNHVRGIVLDLEADGLVRREGERRGLKWRRA